MMKQPVNFRLTPQAIQMLSLLEKKLHKTKTAIVEIALQIYAKENLLPKNNLLSYAGSLSEDEALNLLHTIKTSRRNKTKDNFI